MKNTLLAIGLAVATMPLTFAAQQPNAPAAPSSTATPSAAKTKKHVKKNHKAKTAETPASTAPAVKSATPAK